MFEGLRLKFAAYQHTRRRALVARVVLAAEACDVTATRTRIEAVCRDSWSIETTREILDELVDEGVLDTMHTDAGAIYVSTAITEAWIATR